MAENQQEESELHGSLGLMQELTVCVAQACNDELSRYGPGKLITLKTSVIYDHLHLLNGQRHPIWSPEEEKRMFQIVMFYQVSRMMTQLIKFKSKKPFIMFYVCMQCPTLGWPTACCSFKSHAAVKNRLSSWFTTLGDGSLRIYGSPAVTRVVVTWKPLGVNTRSKPAEFKR